MRPKHSLTWPSRSTTCLAEGPIREGLTMTFDEILAQVLELLQRQGRVSYRALKRRFDLDDEYLEDL